MTNLIFGLFALAFGMLTLLLRFIAPNSPLFSKLGPMKERFGDTAGTVIHVLGYTVMPLAVGTILVMSALLVA